MRTKYVRVPESLEPDTSPSEGTLLLLDYGSAAGLQEPLRLTRPEPVTSEAIPAPNTDVGQDLKFNPPTHHNLYSPSNSGPPFIYGLMYVWQQPQETVHHFWARFLLVKNRIKDCPDDDVVSVFHHNCTDEGILNALDRRHIQSFTELSQVVQKYCAMESTWRSQKTTLEPAAFKQCAARTKRIHPGGSPD